MTNTYDDNSDIVLLWSYLFSIERLDSLWCVGHGKADKVATGQREESHDDRESSVVAEVDGEEGATLDVAEHQQRDEHHPGDD